MGFKSVSKWFIDAATGLLKPIGGALGVTFGPGSSVQDDGTGELTIKAETAGKELKLDGKLGVRQYVDGTNLAVLTSAGLFVRSAKYLGLLETGNSYYHTIGDDGSGNLEIQVTEASKELKLDGKGGIKLRFDTADKLEIKTALVEILTASLKQTDSETYPLLIENDAASETGTLKRDNNSLIIDSGTGSTALKFDVAGNLRTSVTDNGLNVPSAKALALYESGNGYYHTIGDDGTGNLEITVTEAAKYLIADGKGGIKLRFDTADKLEIKTALVEILTASLKQTDSETYPLLIEDDTGAETGSISRSLTQLHVDSGTGGEIALDVATVEIASIDAAGVVIGSPAHQGLLTFVADNDEISTMLRNNDDFIIDSGAGGNMSFGLAGTSYLYLNPGLTTIRNSSLIQENSGVYPMIVAGDNGAQMQMRSISEEVTIVAGSGATGVLTTAFIPAGCTIKRILGRVTQAPGGGATDFDSCINGDVNKSIGDTIAVAVDTTFNNLQDGDGNRTDPGGQILAVAIKTTTDNNVTGTDMKIRYVVFYESFTEPTS